MTVKDLTVLAPEGLVAGGSVEGEDYQYFSLLTGERLDITAERARESLEWHIAVKRSVICVNGGPAGPGGITGACIAPPFSVTRGEFLKLTDEDLLKKFEAVEKIPEDARLVPEGIEPAIFGWREKRGDGWAPAIKGWKLRLADGESFAKMRVRRLGEDGMTITIQYAFQPGKDAPLGEEMTAVIKPGEAFSFRSGEAATAVEGPGWDIKHAGEKIHLNGGVSGPGGAGAIGSNKYGAKWSEVESASDSAAYFMDEYGSIFRNPKWYRYNIDGKHDIHPNGAVYGLRTRDGDFKVQVHDYFEHEGSDLGNMRIRCERLGAAPGL